MGQWIKDVKLKGQFVDLVPLELSHKEGLVQAASDGNLWELWYTSVPSEITIDAYIANALEHKKASIGYPFVVIDKKIKKIIGSTRYFDIQPHNRRVEIGYTWYAKSYQRTAVNTECKFLLMQYAFEELHCIAVQFLTDWHNITSRKAIERLGAKQDGLLRNHRINADGSIRDSAVYSITNQEWLGVKKSLTYKLKQYQENFK